LAGSSVHTCELASSEALESLVARVEPELVVMAAVPSGHPVSGDVQRATYLQHTMAMQFALFRALDRTGSQARLVLIGSSTVYGAGLARNPLAPMRPQSFRGVAKASERLLAELLAAEQGRQLVELRVFCGYGRWMPRQRLLARLLRAALDGSRVPIAAGPLPRDWIHHSDIGRAVLCSLDLPPMAGPPTVINVCSGELVDCHDVSQRLERICGRPLIAEEPFPGGDRMGEVLPGIPPAADELPGWTRRIDLDTGLTDLWHWAVSPEGRSYLLEESD
jgi:nucleoside-diphosphate-sugar epimerase